MIVALPLTAFPRIIPGRHEADNRDGCCVGYLEPLMDLIVEGKIGLSFLITHRIGLEKGPEAHKTFRDKRMAALRLSSASTTDARIMITGTIACSINWR